jgi:PGF-pre-PGF domain-containing protein
VEFTEFPFLGDNSDLNFSIIAGQIGFVVDKGTSEGTEDFDAFFSDLSVRSDRIKDTGIRDIGYHYAGGIDAPVTPPSSGGSAPVQTSIERSLSLKKGENEINYAGSNVGNLITLKIVLNGDVSNEKIIVETDVTKLSESFENAYSVFEITFNKKDLVEEAEFRFRVSKQWLEKNGLSRNEVSLYRFVNGSWVELETVYSGEFLGYYVYTAVSPGFSYFAIAESGFGEGSGIDEPVPEPVVPVEPIVPVEPEPVVPVPVVPVAPEPVVSEPVEQEPAVQEPVVVVSEPGSGEGSFWDLLVPMFLIGVLLIGGVLFYFFKIKKTPDSGFN